MIRGIARIHRRLVSGTCAVLLSTLIGSGIGAYSAHAAQDLKQIGSSGDWEAWSYTESGKKTCFLLSRPSKSLPANARRGEIYMHVTHRNSSGTSDVITFAFGYPLDEKKKVSLSIDKNYYSMLADKEAAWAKSPAEDKKIVKNMIRGRKMLVKATSKRGTKTTDSYSLIGFTAAYKVINKACNVKR